MRDGPFGTDPDTLDRAKTVLDSLRESDLEPAGIRFETRAHGEFAEGFSVVYGRGEPAEDEDPMDDPEIAAIAHLLSSTFGRNPQAAITHISIEEIVDHLIGPFDEKAVRAAVEEVGYEDVVDL